LLVTTAGYDRNVYRSARNIAGVSVTPAGEINALDVLSSRRLLVTKAALDALVESAKSVHGGSEGADPIVRRRATKRVPTKSTARRAAGKKTTTE
jgi:hypothetical protein